MNLLKADVKYYPFDLPRTKWSQTNYWVDEIKMNMLWLVMPEVDGLVHTKWAGNEVSASIDANMEPTLRRRLSGPPIEFMHSWSAMDHGNMDITQDFPSNYLTTMWDRAREANSRLLSELGSNVVLVNFRK